MPAGLQQLVETAKRLSGAADDTITPYGDVTVVDRDNRISISSDTPISDQRDELTAGVTRVPEDSVYRIRANASTESAETVDQLQYSPGYIGEIGIALRVPTPPAGDQEMRSGYWRSSDGSTFGWDATSPFVETVRNTNRQGKIRPADWNGDISGERVEELLQRGAITRQKLGLYNFGSVTYEIFGRDSDGSLIIKEIHTFSEDNGTTLSRQNNPLRVEAVNPSTSDFDVKFADRQATIRGAFTPTNRVKGVLQTGVSFGTDWSPILSLRIKDDFDTVGADVLALQVLADANIVIQLRSDAGSDTAADYSPPPTVQASETSIGADTTPSAAISDGYFRAQRVFAGGGQGTAPTPLGQLDTADLEIKPGRPLTLFVKGLSASGTIDGINTNVEESW